MCTSSRKPKAQAAPETPETLKRPAADAAAVRADAQRLAAARFGTLATDLTRGALQGGKRRTTGGD
jgi:hypothetical protein